MEEQILRLQLMKKRKMWRQVKKRKKNLTCNILPCSKYVVVCREQKSRSHINHFARMFLMMSKMHWQKRLNLIATAGQLRLHGMYHLTQPEEQKCLQVWTRLVGHGAMYCLTAYSQV